MAGEPGRLRKTCAANRFDTVLGATAQRRAGI